MARISLTPPRTLTTRAAQWHSKRSYGAVMDPIQALAHNPKVLRADGRWEMAIGKWNACPAELKHLAEMASAATIGCSWCMDFGYWLSIDAGLDEAKVRDIPRWRDSDAYTDLERLVLEYSEAMTQTPPTVTDELVAALRTHLDEAALVELTMMVAVENQRSRVNSALDLTSQGFKDRCAISQ